MAAKKTEAKATKAGGASNQPKAKSSGKRVPAKRPVLLSGDNPQIAKGEGDGPVREYLDALPGWKGAIARRLDALVARAVPKVHRAVKWNSPMYSTGGSERFLSLHAFNNFMRVTFFRGTLLEPVPPGASKQQDVRYYDVREHDDIDEQQFLAWVRAASRLPGVKL